MMDAADTAQEWWQAVRSIADLVSCEGVSPGAQCQLRERLAQRGFSPDGIGKALEWLDKVSASGNLMSSLGMLQPVTTGFRVAHALEVASLHPRLLTAVDDFRRRGWISQDLAERLLESMRSLATLDWCAEEIESALGQILAWANFGAGSQGQGRYWDGDVRDHCH